MHLRNSGLIACAGRKEFRETTHIMSDLNRPVFPAKSPLAFALALLAASIASAPALAQAYPTHPVRMMIPFPPAGPADIIGRLVAVKLSIALGQQFVPENKGGNNGNIGADIVAHAAPDGYTVMLLPSALAANASLYSKLPYSLTGDLTGVAGLAIFPLVLVAHPSLGVNSVAGLIALAKAKPGTINFASAGSGGGAHLAAEAFKVATGTNMVHVPYKGTGPAVTDTLGGQVGIMFASVPSVLQHVRAGKLIALGVTSSHRSSVLPEVPTIAEAGVPGYELVSWFGIVVPAGTPAPVINRLSEESLAILKTPDYLERLQAEGGEVLPLNAAQFNEFIKKETLRWAKVVKDAGAKLD
jgi:tripartite-type tricarboxylate transporter receptor subunit TctC